jgi:hypothetical protein
MRSWIACVAAALALTACAAGTPQGSPTTSAGGSPTTSEAASATANPSGPFGACGDPNEHPHDLPSLEAVLPVKIANRDMLRWSAAGWCLVGLSLPEPYLTQFKGAIESEHFDVAALQYAIEGRSFLDDPPFFVHVVPRSADQETSDLRLFFLERSIGVLDMQTFDLNALSSMTVRGKSVLVGPAGLLQQDDHQRGGLYWYESADYTFAVVTDDPAWAADALRQLP